MYGFTKEELSILKKLSTQGKIQDFLNELPINFEKKGETLYSPRRVLREQKAHCFEGALLAAAALAVSGEEPVLLGFDTLRIDDSHVVALYKKNGYWGAISKTNHPVIRFRDPIYKNVRELALSYFHEYFEDKGIKVLRSYTKPFSLRRFGNAWMTAEEDLWYLNEAIDAVTYYPLVPKGNERYIRKADQIELDATELREWKKEDPRT